MEQIAGGAPRRQPSMRLHDTSQLQISTLRRRPPAVSVHDIGAHRQCAANASQQSTCHRMPPSCPPPFCPCLSGMVDAWCPLHSHDLGDAAAMASRSGKEGSPGRPRTCAVSAEAGRHGSGSICSTHRCMSVLCDTVTGTPDVKQTHGNIFNTELMMHDAAPEPRLQLRPRTQMRAHHSPPDTQLPATHTFP